MERNSQSNNLVMYVGGMIGRLGSDGSNSSGFHIICVVKIEKAYLCAVYSIFALKQRHYLHIQQRGFVISGNT